MVKTFDLAKKYPQYKKGDLHNNLDKFIKDFGKKFRIKYGSIVLDDVIIMSVYAPSSTKFYRMMYDIPNRTTTLAPFIIDFIDPFKSVVNNNTYIANIQKTKDISGSNMTKICLAINRILGVTKTSLGDGTQITCEKTKQELDLSYIKLIERGTTFYMNLGFQFDANKEQSTPLYFYKFNDQESILKHVNMLINNIKSIKTTDIIKELENTFDIINEAVKGNYSKKLKILYNKYPNPTRDNIICENDPEQKLVDIFKESKDVLDILYEYKNEKFIHKILINLFKTSCEKYFILYKYFVENERMELSYGKKAVGRRYRQYFEQLAVIKNWYWYFYTF
jgi:hypothetical protein